MNTVQKIKAQLATTKNNATSLGLEKEVGNIESLITRYNSKQLTVLVCGEFKRGKSSFINAFLGEDICPVAEGIATSAVSIIRYGQVKKVIRHYGNVTDRNVEPCKEEVPFEKIAAFADGTANEIDNTIMLEIEIPSERLKNGLTIIDTPGVGSLDPRHLFLTLYALPKADVIFFITDAGEPLTSTELNFYQKHILSTGKPNRVLVNKSDTKLRDECEQIIADTKCKIEKHCQVDNVQVLPVSSKLWSEYNADPQNEKKRQKSHMEDALAAIASAEKDFDYYFSEYIRSRYIDLLQQLIDMTNNKKTEISKTDIAVQKEEYQRQIVEIRQLRDNLNNSNSEFRRRIARIIKDSQAQVMNIFAEESILLSSNKLENLLKTEQAKSEGGEEFVIKEINKAIVKLSEHLDEEIDAGIKKVLDIIGTEITLSNETFNGRLKVNITPLQQSFMDKAMRATRQSLPFMGVTALAGGITGAGLGFGAGLFGIESALVPTIGIAGIALTPIAIIAGIAGVAAGITYVAKSIKEAKTIAEINNIRSQIAPRIQIAMNELRQYVQNRYDEFNELLLQNLTDTATQMAKQMQDVFELLKECEDNEQKKISKIKELDAQLNFLNTQLTQAKVVNTNPFV